MNNQVFQYNGQPVTFQLGSGDIMVNATEMAKPFGKRPVDYLALPSTNELIKAKVRKSHIDENQLVTTVRGGSNPGTWLHEDIALDFAQWLSVDFRLWCNDRIKELLRFGMTATQPTIEAIIDDPDNAIKLLTALKAERAEKERIAAQNEAHKQQLQEQAPAVTFTSAVSGSKSSCLIGELAKILRQNGVEIGEKRLFEWLRQNGYLGRHGERYNIPNQVYVDQGLFEIKKGVRSGSGGILHATTTTKVTGKGQIYFVNKFLKTTFA